ncbi:MULTISPECIES: alpha,alpha-trehalose-phosphate synthase (UDP-forming) [unclassified Blastomonas]|jgi:trehalose 6-phosphate synthase|uniref:alpha,alpha-trehalose-phosphate synthase (UDP-forming) n=1 Tax=Blastomonas TaxID=150203 RepID=UPI0006B8B12C|nr:MULTISPECIES: trehalose-6-phosphate synthase [unclassified Blastomonas]AOG00579.1 glycosyltransferase 20 family protein [Blastomonas sp. RAC04]KPF73813.1 alpha,alpha-trehalose-phosphate synthase [Blastomonas sp. AAP25]
MSRLIAISNRVQAAQAGENSNRGGLAVALSAALRASNGIWFGWSGEQTDEFSGQISFRRQDGVATATIDLEAQDIEEYYNGFANRTLWPLFHYRLDLTEIARDFAGGYARVNARFADTVAPLIEPDDMIWVHDYHLIPLGKGLRDRGFENRLGFFLHTPWPPASLMVSLPNHRELVASLLSHDVIGFHTDEWRASFIDYIVTHLDARIEGEFAHYDGRVTRLLVCPIGLDTTEFTSALGTPAALSAEERLITSAVGRQVIVGVDRLDYSKGLQERFLAYEQLLNVRPDLREKVFMLQIAPPSRGDVASYQQIRADLNSLSGGINGEFASIDWVPVRYVNKGYAREELFGIYRASRVGLVTPLRDGMNLVAKEYVAAQNPEDPGVLVLSRFAGASVQLDAALIINPHSSEDMADAISRALVMPLEERKERHAAMLTSVVKEDVRWWSAKFIAALAEPEPQEDRPKLALASSKP